MFESEEITDSSSFSMYSMEENLSGCFKLKLVADSGSTKTHWCLVEGGIVIQEVFTDGINPFYQSADEVLVLLEQQLVPKLKSLQVEEVHFYGAGCAIPDKIRIVSQALEHFFANATIGVYNDLLGAARALFQSDKGIACIMGTGSNSCYYDGHEIVQNVSPLGFILGDEGGGAVLGKLFVADCLKNQMPEWIRDKFLDEYELTPAMILDSVYKQAFPNRFLAKFTPFILEHIEEPAIFNLVYDAFDAFFVRNVMQYTVDEEVRVGFVGSIAHYFRDTLEIVASEREIELNTIVQNPMEGLVHFHAL